MTQTEKFSFLSPDFSTLWNYRSEIIVFLFEYELKDDPKKKLETIGNELKFLIKGIMKSPKSYTLWFQRQWAIEKGLILERQLKLQQSQILENELLLCNKMLKMDERNFHCWNYSLWVVETFLKEHTLRGKELLELSEEEDIF